MSAIPRSFIDDLLARANIVSVIEKRIKLKKRGNNHTACCPFHNEKTPSFSVSESKQFFHCFGCGENGNVLSFLMKYNNLNFVDAVETLAEELGVPIPQNQSSHHSTAFASYDIFEQCLQFYRSQLSHSDEALEYATLRGLDDKIIDFFQIGYAPNEWRTLANAIASNTEKREILISSGLLINNNDNIYDRFRNRLMFPIHNRRGKVIGFAGRVIDPQDNPKYLNSPESPWFKKREELYGLYQLLNKTRNPNYILVTEGYMDVLALAQNGIHQCVASMGTSLSQEHLQQLFRITKKVILAFDGDKAGINAADRGLQTLLPYMQEGNLLEFLVLPTNSDPDSLIREKGTDAFEQFITEHSLSLSKYFISLLNRSTDPKNPDDIPQIFAIARPIIETLDANSTFRTALIQSLADYLEISVDTVANHIRLKSKNTSKSLKSAQLRNNAQRTHAQDIVLSLLNFPEIALKLSIDWTQLGKIKGISLIKEMVEKIHENPEIKAGNLIEHWRNTAYYELLSQLAQEKYLLLSSEESLTQTQGLIALLQKKNDIEEWLYLQQLVSEKGLKGLDASQLERYQKLSNRKTNRSL